MHPLAEKLNDDIGMYTNFLSRKGREIFFPSKGILGQTAEAKGKKLNATIGIALEDDNSPMRLPALDDAINLQPNDVFPYAPSFGKLPLREKWQEMMQDKNPSLTEHVSLPVVTCGLTHSLSMAAYLFLDEGDTLILPDLYWGNYNLMFSHVYGITLQTFNTFTDGGFDCNALKKALAEGSGKKVLLLNFPNNPTGYTPTNSEVDQILSIIKQQAESGDEIIVINDDAYFGLVYEDDIYTESLFAPLASLHEHVLAVKVDGATKEDYVWGHRVGFCTISAKNITVQCANAFASKLAGAVRATISNACHLSQSLLLKAYNAPTYVQEKKRQYETLRHRYQLVQQALENSQYTEFFTPLPFNSGYFMCVELAEGLNAEDVRTTLLEQFDTGVIATGNKIRIAYSSLPTQHIHTLFENLYNACKTLSSPTPHHEHNAAIAS